MVGRGRFHAQDIHAGPGNEEGDRPQSLVGVGLDLLLGAQHGNGPVPDEVVEPGQRPLDNPLMLIPWSAFSEDRFADPTEKEGLKQGLVGLVKQQVAVVAQVGGRYVVESQLQEALGLIDLAERLRVAPKLVQVLTQDQAGELLRKLENLPIEEVF